MKRDEVILPLTLGSVVPRLGGEASGRLLELFQLLYEDCSSRGSDGRHRELETLKSAPQLFVAETGVLAGRRHGEGPGDRDVVPRRSDEVRSENPG